MAEKPFVAKKMKIGKVEKLVTNLKDKTACAVYIKTLNQASKHGLKSAIRFGQRYWMKAYIMLNSTLRTAAKIEFENNFFKLMNNSIFGKTIKNIRNPKDIKLDTSRDKYARYVKL